MHKDGKSASKTPVAIKNYTSQPGFKRKIVTQQSKSQKEFNDTIRKKQKQRKNLEELTKISKKKKEKKLKNKKKFQMILSKLLRNLQPLCKGN